MYNIKLKDKDRIIFVLLSANCIKIENSFCTHLFEQSFIPPCCTLYNVNCTNHCIMLYFIKNVSSSTSHKKNSVFTSFRLSLREFKKILPNTFIYESILIKIYMNTNIMNTKKYSI